MTLVLRPARPDEVDGLLALRDDAAGWLLERGIRQWHPGEFDRSMLAEWVDDGLVHVLDHGGIAAMVAVLWADPAIWPDDDGRAGYVHLLAVAPERAGQGLGSAVLAWAERHVGAHGRDLVRLDHVDGNDRLARWYADRGYQVVSQVAMSSCGPVDDPYPAVLWAKHLVDPPD